VFNFRDLVRLQTQNISSLPLIFIFSILSAARTAHNPATEMYAQTLFCANVVLRQVIWLTPPNRTIGVKLGNTLRSYRGSTNPSSLQPIMPCLNKNDSSSLQNRRIRGRERNAIHHAHDSTNASVQFKRDQIY
jgi:hypothetical protein